MPAKNKRNKRNTRKVKRGGNKKALADLDVHVQYVIAHTGELNVDVQTAMLEIVGADIDILHTYVKQADEKKATISMLIKKLNEIKTSGDNIIVITARLALRRIRSAIKLGSGDSPVLEVRSPFYPSTPKTRKKSPPSSSS
jgi:hypothetical protein